MLCPGRESVRLFQRLRGTTHHLVLFAGALATGETHRRLQVLADATMHAFPDRIEPHLIVPHELPEDLVGKGEILLDPKVFRLCLPGPRVARVGRSGAVRCGLGTRAWLHRPRLAVDGAFPPSRGHLRTAPGGVWSHVTSGTTERIHARGKA